MWMTQIRQETIKRLVSFTDLSLSALLILGAIIIVGIGLLPGHEMFKAIVLAYIIFP